MSDIAEVIRTAISSSVSLTAYIGVIPATVEEGIGVRLNDGASPTTFFGQTATVSYPLLQIALRSKAYGTGHTDAKAILDKLNKYVDTATGVRGVTQVGDIIHLGRNSNNLHEFQVNFRVII